MAINRVPGMRKNGKITVVIPALNESATISSVVRFALSSSLVGEVLVLDDGSIDDTAQLALRAGAKVITSTMLGKGTSMEDGMREAKYGIILYLDGDITGLKSGSIEEMAAPILQGEADMVKAKFARTSGRVTTLTAKPLINTYFPELTFLDQPLGGIMAARKSLLENLIFENDYGVDIGLVVDAFLARARVIQVDIGSITNRNHPLEFLSEMATQVARALLERAARAGRLRSSFIRNSKEKERLGRFSLEGFLGRVRPSEKIALFDMDGVLLNGRFVRSLAAETEREDKLAPLLDNFELTPHQRMKKIAAVFKNVRKEVFESVARSIPLMPGAAETVVALRRAGYRVGIVTDSYQVAAETVRRRVFADFTFSHFMQFKNGKADGKVNICPAMIHPEGCAEHDHCKLNVLLHLKDRFGIAFEQILAVGDGPNDTCMLKAAGTSIAFQPKSRMVARSAQQEVQSMNDISLFLLNRQLSAGANDLITC